MRHITTMFEEDEQGWIEARCRCGWEFLAPDFETAADAFGEHCYDEGARDGQEDVAANVREHGAP